MADADDKRDDMTPNGQAGKWLSAIERAQQSPDMAEWSERCGKIRRKFRYEDSAKTKTRKYQVLWATLEILRPAVYSRPPVGVIGRRYRDKDPVGRAATEILERGVNFTLDLNGFHDELKQVRDDFLLYGRGVARVKYEPVFLENYPETQDTLDTSETEGVEVERAEDIEDAAGDPSDVIDFENVKVEFVQRKDFVHEPARTWIECNWVAFRAYLSRDELVERFGEEIGNEVGLDASPGAAEDDARHTESDEDKATVWEIWDKAKSRVLWVAAAYPDVLEESKPYLKLDGFFPCPRPAFGTMTTETLVPVPDFVFYQDQAEEVDTLTARIAALAQSLKLVGFYPAGPSGAGSPEIERAIKPGVENVMIAVNSWAAFKEGGQGGAPIVWLPVQAVGEILQGCVKLRQQLLDDINQIVGISDIMRGDGDAQETATAQSIKAQYGSIRIRQRQEEMARFARDICRLVAQVIATQFQPETLEKMTNIKLPTAQDVQQAQMQQQAQFQQVAQQYQMQAAQAQQTGQQIPPPPQPPAPVDLGPTVEDVFGLLRDNATRRFRIDIETDSTIIGDESRERQDRTDFINTTTKFMEAWGPMVGQNPELAPLASGLLLFGVRAFRVGRELEELIEETADKIQGGAQQPKPPAPQEVAEQHKAQAVQIKAQAEIQKAQVDAQAKQADAQSKIQIAQIKMQQAQMDHQHKQAAQAQNMAKLEAEMQLAYMEAQAKAQAVAGAQQQAAQAQAGAPVPPGAPGAPGGGSPSPF